MATTADPPPPVAPQDTLTSNPPQTDSTPAPAAPTPLSDFTASLSVLERLLIAQSVHDVGDQNWPAVSGIMEGHPLLAREKGFFAPERCELAYKELMGELGFDMSQPLPEPKNPQARPHLKLARKYYRLRVEEVKSSIYTAESKFKTLVQDIDDIRSGRWDERLSTSLTSSLAPPPPEPAELMSEGEPMDLETPEPSPAPVPAQHPNVQPSVEVVPSSSQPLAEDDVAPPAPAEGESAKEEAVEAAEEQGKEEKMDVAEAVEKEEKGKGMGEKEGSIENVDAALRLDVVPPSPSPAGAGAGAETPKSTATATPAAESPAPPQQPQKRGKGGRFLKKNAPSSSGSRATAGTGTGPASSAASTPVQHRMATASPAPESPAPSSPAPAAAPTPAEEKEKPPSSREGKRWRVDEEEGEKEVEEEVKEEVKEKGMEREKEDEGKGREREREKREDTAEAEDSEAAARRKRTEKATAARKASLAAASKRKAAEMADTTDGGTDDDGRSTPAPSKRPRPTPDDASAASKRFQKLILTLWADISSHRSGAIFNSPIRANEAPGYHELVHRPMDLSTIKRRVRDGQISTSLEFAKDTLLMFANSMMYNEPGSDIWVMAEEMMNFAETAIKNFRQTESNLMY